MSRRALTWAFASVALLLAAQAFAADTVYYYSSDTLHSEVVVTDQNRNVVERTHYAPYGQVLDRDLRDGPGYTGHAEDPETGLVYMQQRYYDPEAGRFLSTDPVQADGGGGSFNRYWYANDNPYRYTDPDGRCVEDACIVEGGVAVGAGVVYLTAAALVATGVCVEACGKIENSIGDAADKVGDKIKFLYSRAVHSRSDIKDNVQQSSEHTKGARPSTEAKHEKGKSRAKADSHGGEKGDDRRAPYGKRPQGHKGPWPPKQPPKPPKPPKDDL